MEKLKEISIEITNECCMSCIHCSSGAAKKLENELSLDEIKELLAQAKGLGACIFTISGGEPLLRNDLKEIIGCAREKNFQIRLQTSGTYNFGNGFVSIPDSFLDFYATDLNFGDKIVYSVHGLGSTHERITKVKGSFRLVMESIKKGVSNDVFTEVHTVVNALNYKEIPKIASDLEKIGVNSWHILRLVPQGRCEKHPELIMDAKEFKTLQEILIDLTKENHGMKIYLGHNVDKRYWSNDSFPIESCNLGKNKILIRPDGEVSYCAALKYSRFGNVRKNNLKYFWNEHPKIVLFRNFLEKDYKKLKGKCASCEIKEVCRGSCVAQRLYAYNDLFRGPDPLCYKKQRKG